MPGPIYFTPNPVLAWAEARHGPCARTLYSTLTQMFNGDKARAALTLANYVIHPDDVEIAERSDRDALRALGNALLFMIGEDDPYEWLTSTKGVIAESIIHALQDVHELDRTEAVQTLVRYLLGDPAVRDYILTALDNVVYAEDVEGYEEARALAAPA